MVDSGAGVAALIRRLAAGSDAERLQRDVEALASTPRSSLRAPKAMRRAQEYVGGELRRAGWEVDNLPFDVRWQVGSTDRHGSRALPLKLRLHRRLRGTNIIADLPGPGTPDRRIGAHLDTVDGSRAPTTTRPGSPWCWRRHG
jgi:hypothetical protein